MVDHAVKHKATFDAKVMQTVPRVVVFQEGDLVQVHATEWVHMFATIKKLIPMWSVPRCVVNRKLNSYTLETLEGVPLSREYSLRRLRAFHPWEGTELAKEELARLEEESRDLDLDLDEDSILGGSGELR